MSSEEAKQIVSAGSEQRKADRETATQEALLEQYEQEQIRACNENCAGAKLQRRMEETGRLNREQAEARRAARAQAQAKEQAREDAAMAAVRYYGLACLGVIWLTAVTRFPFWAAVALMAASAVFPAVYIFRLYHPIER